MPITVTPAAIEHLKSMLPLKEFPAIRFGVKQTGCSGFMYYVEPAEITGIEPTDFVIDRDGMYFILDSADLKYIKDTEIDYAKKGIYEGLIYNNPNVSAECGCGNSFQVK